jgi:hypothetical protein
MLRFVLLLAAVISFLLAAFAVDAPTVNDHPLSYLYLGLAFWAASFISVPTMSDRQ